MKKLLIVIALFSLYACGARTEKSSRNNITAFTSDCAQNEVCPVQLISSGFPLQFSFPAPNNVSGTYIVQGCDNQKSACIPTIINITCNNGMCSEPNGSVTSPQNGTITYVGNNGSIQGKSTVRVFKL